MSIRIDNDVLTINDIAWPSATIEVKDQDLSEILDEEEDKTLIMRVRRGQIPLDNGWTFNLIWGNGAYCSNHGIDLFGALSDDDPDAEFNEQPEDAEIAAWDPEGRWFDFAQMGILSEGTQILGYVPAFEILAWIHLFQTHGHTFPVIENDVSAGFDDFQEDVPEDEDEL